MEGPGMVTGHSLKAVMGFDFFLAMGEWEGTV